MSTVVIERLDAFEAGTRRDYLPGCAALTSDYGSPAWEARPEVLAILGALGYPAWIPEALGLHGTPVSGELRLPRSVT